MKLIVIDVQKGITDERLYDFDGFIKNVTNIIDAYPTDSDKSNTVTFTNDVIYIDWRMLGCLRPLAYSNCWCG